MQVLVEQLRSLPTSSLNIHDTERFNAFVTAHEQHIVKKQGLLRICASDGPIQQFNQDEWLITWRSSPEVQETHKEEMDALARALSSW